MHAQLRLGSSPVEIGREERSSGGVCILLWGVTMANAADGDKDSPTDPQVRVWSFWGDHFKCLLRLLHTDFILAYKNTPSSLMVHSCYTQWYSMQSKIDSHLSGYWKQLMRCTKHALNPAMQTKLAARREGVAVWKFNTVSLAQPQATGSPGWKWVKANWSRIVGVHCEKACPGKLVCPVGCFRVISL